MKKLLAFLMAIMIAVFVAACDSTKETAEEPEVSPAVSEIVEETEAAEEQEEKVKIFGDFEYLVEDDAVTITKYVGDSNKVKIPDEIDGSNVCIIGEEAFADAQCPEVHFSQNLQTICVRAFNNCTNLEVVIFPNQLSQIEEEAFKNCLALEAICISGENTRIDRTAFVGCDSIEEIYLGDNVGFSLEDGVLYDAESNIICEMLDGTTDIEEDYDYSIEDDYAVIENYCGSEDTVKVPIMLGGKLVRKIGEKAFARAMAKHIIIRDGVEELGTGAFCQCIRMKSIELPDSLTKIGEEAFNDCRSLNSIVIPERITEIAVDTFKNCISLEYVYIPGSVNSIAVEEETDEDEEPEFGPAFNGTDNLRTIEVSEDNSSFAIKNNALYAGDEVVFELVGEDEGYTVDFEMTYFVNGSKLDGWEERRYDLQGKLIAEISNVKWLGVYYALKSERYTYDSDGRMNARYASEYNSSRGEYQDSTYEFEYDSEGRLVCCNDYKIEYYSSGQIKQINYELASIFWQEEYAEDGRLVCLKLMDDEGVLMYRDEYTYDDAGNAIVCTGYNADNTVVPQWERELDENGNEINIWVYTLRGETAFHRVSTYDENNNLIGYKEYCGDGSLSFYKENTYDENNNILTSVSYSGDGQIVESSQWEYDNEGRVIYTEEFDGETTTSCGWTYDAEGRVICTEKFDGRNTTYCEWTYDDAGREILMVNRGKNGRTLYTRKSVYNENGLRVEFIADDYDGDEPYHEVVVFDDAGEPIEKVVTGYGSSTCMKFVTPVDEREIQISEYEEYMEDREKPNLPITLICDGYGNEIYSFTHAKRIYMYNSRGQEIWGEGHIYDPGYRGTPYTAMEQTYDAAGNLLSYVEYMYGSVRDKVEYTYDSRGNKIACHQNWLGNETFWEKKYDDADNCIWQSTKAYYGDGIFDYWTIYEYDSEGNTISKTSYDENGNVIEE